MKADATINEVAAISGRHPESLRRLARKGKLPGAYRLGSIWLVHRGVFEAHRNGKADWDGVDDSEGTAGRVSELREGNEQFRKLCMGAVAALRSYQYGNSSPDLAKEIADALEEGLQRNSPVEASK